MNVNLRVSLCQFSQTWEGRRAGTGPASALILLRVPWKQESHGREAADAREPVQGRPAPRLIEHSRSAQAAMSDMGGGTPGRHRGQPPRLLEGGLPLLKMSKTLAGSLGTTWEVSIKKKRKSKSVWKENFAFNPSCGTWLFLRAYGTLRFLVSGGYQRSQSWLELFQLLDISDNLKETTICWFWQVV